MTKIILESHVTLGNICALFRSTSYNQPYPVKDEDTESGKGPSLPHSPHTIEGYGSPLNLSQDSDSDERLSDQFRYISIYFWSLVLNQTITNNYCFLHLTKIQPPLTCYVYF